MNELYVISCFIAFVLIFVQAFFVISRNKKVQLSRNWFLFSIAAGIATWGLWGMVVSDNQNQMLFFRYVLDLGVIFLPVFYFNFISVLIGVREKYAEHIKVIYGVAGALIVFDFFPAARHQISGLEHSFNYWPSLSPIYILFLLFLLTGFGYAFYLAFTNYNRVTGVVRNQLKYILAASGVALVGGVINFWPFMVNFFPFGNLVLALSMMVIGYALVKYPLPSFKRIVSILYIYAFITLFAYMFFHLVAFVDVGYLGGVYTKESLLVGILFSVLFSLFFLPFLKYVQETSDILFFRGRNPYKMIKDLSLKMNKTLELNTLLNRIKKEFQKTLEVSEVKMAVFASSEEGKAGKKYSTSHAKVRKNSALKGIREIKVRGSIPEKEKDVATEMEKNNAEVVVPLFFKNEIIGVILLGEKEFKEGYSQGDLEFLETIGPHLAVAIHNALLYKKVSELNDNLKKKVEEQTANIKSKNQRLQKMISTQSEFLDIAGHQLRTPVSVIKGMLNMIKENDVSSKKREEFLDSVLQNAFKLEEIIETMLTASEVDSGNFGFDLGAVKLRPVLKEVYEKEKGRAEQKNIKFNFNIPEKYLMPVLSNERYLKQVLVNLVDNAFQYTKEGGEVTIKAKPLKEKVNIEISDTGIGIPKKEKDNLFNKFSRAENAVNTYGNGSGLGLFVVKKIIDTHTKDAKVYIKESKVNKGTTFVVSLPIVKNA